MSARPRQSFGLRLAASATPFSTATALAEASASALTCFSAC
jgi:hypothetical protein